MKNLREVLISFLEVTMVDAIPLFEKKGINIRHNSHVDKNISYAREWYRRKKVPKEITFRLIDTGSQYGGTIKKGILQISFTPEFHVVWPNLAVSISTLDEEWLFRGNLEEEYAKILSHYEKMEEKREKGSLKLSVASKTSKHVEPQKRENKRS